MNESCITKGPIINHYPIPTKRTPSQASDYFIPIGWAIFLHDYTTGLPSGESAKNPISAANAETDWTEGTLDKINNSDDPWNVVWARPRPTANDPNARTVNQAHYVNFVQAAGNPGASEKVINVWPTLLKRRHKDTDYIADNETYSLVAPINWYDQSNGGSSGYLDQYLTAGDGELETAINAIKNESNLAGWVIADEPYLGEGADLSSFKDDLSENSRSLWYWQGYDLMEGEFDSPHMHQLCMGREESCSLIYQNHAKEYQLL